MPGTDKEVNNEFDNDYGTAVDLVTATEDSINTAFVDLTIEIGAGKVVEAAVDAGIPDDTPGLTANAVITLGTASVRNIDMANAYATFAAQGEAAPWYTVQEVKGANGGTRYQAKPKTTRAFDEDVMADLSYALQQVVRERHRHRGAGARPAGGGQDRHRRAATGHHDVRVVRRLHAAAVGGGRLLQGHRHGPTSTASAACRRSSAASTRPGSGRRS